MMNFKHSLTKDDAFKISQSEIYPQVVRTLKLDTVPGKLPANIAMNFAFLKAYDFIFVNNNNIAHRPGESRNGTKDDQLWGLMGQLFIEWLCTGKMTYPQNKADGGIDFFLNAKRIDVKGKGSNYPISSEYCLNLLPCQVNHSSTDYYIFFNYIKPEHTLQIAGLTSKASVIKGYLSKYYKEPGSTLYNNSGKGITFKGGVYAIPQGELIQINNVNDILNNIKSLC